ncbi:olfactory receptor 1M1-like [Hyperolius riggenbachi]|uniref:olfactory receptor 1M1-like n=1 Tax=Hyperolius riggenbachi TaxID=752182 RepID=UPI0035A34755
MNHSNCTSPDRYILLGLSELPNLQVAYFLLFFVMYILTLLGNFLIILAVRINPRLQTPMYYFLSNLSLVDFGFCSNIVPKMLVNTLSNDKSISMIGCAVQMFAYIGQGETECVILAIMAYDRFAAICRPLHYNTIMNKKLCQFLVASSWSVCLMNSASHVILMFGVRSFHSNKIRHFFCEVLPLLQISCRDTSLNRTNVYISAVAIVSFSFLLTLSSYVGIVSTILKIRSSEGRRKTFSTCGSHLTVVTLYYGTILFMYMRPPSSQSPETDKAVCLLYTAITPMLNPFVYSIRNKDVKGTITKDFFRFLK